MFSMPYRTPLAAAHTGGVTGLLGLLLLGFMVRR
mgnify:CR=1 FL=1